MTRTTLISTVITGAISCFTSLSAETSTPNFWDEIPASPSTTAAKEIKDNYWHGQFKRVNKEVAETDKSEIAFFGDSITWHWSLGAATGKEIWKEHYAKYNPINMGNSGDITPVMLYRVTQGNLDFAKGKEPKVVVLLCGTNNYGVTVSHGGKVKWDLGVNCPPEDVAHGARAIAQVVRRKSPQTKIIMLGILPVSNEIKWQKCQKTNAFNAALSYDKNEVIYLDLEDKFLLPDGSINKKLFTDGTHLTPEGYQVWAKSMEPIISKIMEEPKIKPTKIMLIGGSITEGKDSSSSYRRYLDGMLRRSGHLIDFIGSRKKHHDNKTDPDTYQYDVDHEGHWGKGSQWIAKNIPIILKTDIPDVVLIQIGTEDIASGSQTGIEITQNIDEVIKALRSKNKNMKIILSKTIPIKGKKDEVTKLNYLINQYMKTNSTDQSPIILADQNTGFDTATDLTNGSMLPNATGAKKMATIFATAINKTFNKKNSK